MNQWLKMADDRRRFRRVPLEIVVEGAIENDDSF